MAFLRFTATNVLNGAGAPAKPKNWTDEIYYHYSQARDLEKFGKTICPLEELRIHITEHQKSKHYVVLSIGWSDCLEGISNPFALRHARKCYQQILDKLNSISTQYDVIPIVVITPQPTVSNDNKLFYTALKIAGLCAMTLQALGVLGLVISAQGITMALARKINTQYGFYFIASILALGLGNYILPLRSTIDILWNGKDIGMTMFGNALETFYQPRLEQAKNNQWPILDLANTFDPYDNVSSEDIVSGITTIVKDASIQQGLLYKGNSFDQPFVSEDNPGNRWYVKYVEDPKNPRTPRKILLQRICLVVAGCATLFYAYKKSGHMTFPKV